MGAVQQLGTWLGEYGYAGVALGVLLESAGVPLPGDATLLAAAFAAAHGLLSLPVVIAVAATAGVVGDNVGYLVGHRLGRPWVERHGRWVLLTPLRLRRMDRFFDRFGAPAIALARFVAGVRVVTAVSAGVSRMRWRVFVRYNVAGALAWATLTGLAGFAVGRGWSGAQAIVGHSGVVLAGLVPAVLVSLAIFHRLRRSWLAQDEESWPRRLAWQWGWIAVMSLTATVIFAKVAEDVAERETAPFDGPVRAWVLAHHTPGLDAVFGVATRLGSPLVLLPVTLLAAAWLWKRGGFWLAATVVAAPAAAAASVLALKDAFSRTRPPGALALHQVSYSFPSGHTTAVTAVVCTMAYVFWQEGLAPHWTLGVTAAAVALVGLSRVYLDVHWATDVIGGWSVGLFITTACVALYERLRLDRRKEP